MSATARRIRVLPGLVALALVGAARAGIIDVPTPATPTIQSAIVAAMPGDEIVVQPRDPDAPFPFDAYYEAIDLNGKAVTIRSVDPSDPAIVATTVINAAGLGASAVRCDSGEGAGTILDGLTITGGNAIAPSPYGGGLNAFNGSPTVRRCVFIGNTATFGGAVYASSGTPTFEDCTFTGNQAVGNGTGFAGAGGALYLNEGVICTRCTFDGNESQDRGGAVFLSSATSTFVDCTFTDNVSAGHGGAVHVRGGADPKWTRCRIAGNHTDGAGGGVYGQDSGTTMVLENCLVHDNVAVAAGGGGVFAASLTGATLRYCTIAANSAGLPGGGTMVSAGGAMTIVNTIVWGNAPDGVGGAAVLSYVDDQSGAGTGTNINADPKFANAAAGDFRLLAGSPCIDRGDSMVLLGPNPVDLDGLPRALDDPDTVDAGVSAYGLTVDLGAYEFVPDVVAPTCTGDTNGDGLVDVSDLVNVILAWGACP